MSQPILFVGGVHGSGKTTLCRMLADELPAAHVTAGALIREAATCGHVVTVGAQDKAVPDLGANQAALLRGLSAYRTRTTDARPVLLDGHFTLIDPIGEILDVPAEVFAAIAPVAVLLVESKTETVNQRLAARASEAPSIQTIAQLTLREHGRAVATANALRIPIFILAGDGSVEQVVHAVIGPLRSLLSGVA